jgi:hypothetical protein
MLPTRGKVQSHRRDSLLPVTSSSTHPGFRAPASSDSAAAIAFAQLIQHHNPLIVSERVILRDRLTLLVGADGSLVFSSLGRFLLEPFLAHSVFGWVFERMKRGVVTAAVTLEARCGLRVGVSLEIIPSPSSAC